MNTKIKLGSLVLIPLIFIFIVYPSFFKAKNSSCSDKTLTNHCSVVNPYFCKETRLVENSSYCGCSSDSTPYLDKCLSIYQTNPKNVSLDYTLNGKKGSIKFTVYEGAYNYIKNLSPIINFNNNISLVDFRLKNLDERIQTEFLYPLVLSIQKITPNKEDQLRVAISLVQNIPFEKSNKVIMIGDTKTDYQRRAYEVVYETKGVCGEKSELLIFLLRTMGYGTAFIYYPLENHEGVGISCPKGYSLPYTEYCFIETTGPSLISDNKTEYLGQGRLKSVPKIIEISEGISLRKRLREFNDAKDLISIRETMKKEGKINFIQYWKFKIIKKNYGIPNFEQYQF